MTGPCADLHRRFGIPGAASVVEGRGGLPVVRVATPLAQGEVYLHGGQVTSWRPHGGDDLLFVSRLARFAEGTAIRGGIPICFPWFGGHPDRRELRAHGFARTRRWSLHAIDVATGDSGEGEAGAVSIVLGLTSDDDTRTSWPHEFRLTYRVTFGSILRLSLTISNIGGSAWRCEEALHSYFRVASCDETRVGGLDGIHYLDQLDATRECVQRGDVTFSGETDRIYLDVPERLTIDDIGAARTVDITTRAARTAVIWNPWIAKAGALADLGDDEWQQMVCVESCNVGRHAVDIEPGESHTMSVAVTTRDRRGDTQNLSPR